ncbi:MAG: A24 family peptidase, partial [Cyanobacteria bacterium REEB65]|nr:A24 family peptidase [Cyanobacteria bacterium REEB65]
DVDYMVLPDSVTLPMIWVGLLFHVLVPAGSAANVPDARGAVLGAVAGYLAFRFIEASSRWLLGRDGMGRGDAKLAAMMGAWVGPILLVVALFAGFVIGALVGLLVEAARRRWNPVAAWRAIARHETRPFPFGPALVLGGFASIFGGEQLMAWYLGLLRG